MWRQTSTYSESMWDSDWQEATAQRPGGWRTRCHIESWNLSRADAQVVSNIRTSTSRILISDRQNVVIVEAGRFSRSAEFVTSSELLCLLNLLYNVLSECCDEYINLYNFTEGFRVVFRFLTHIYLWANFLSHLGFPGALVTELMISPALEKT